MNLPKKVINGVEYTLKENNLGYLELSPLPTVEALTEYYEDKYYQNPEVATFQNNYSQEELRLNTLQFDLTSKIWSQEMDKSIQSVFDIGCGEGFFLNEFQKRGIKIAGNDYSSEGIRKFNPHLAKDIVFGSAEKDIKERKSKKEQYDIINLGNVLEHVIDPAQLLSDVQPLLSKDGLFRIVVPNDASSFQELLRKKGLAGYEWFHPLDHISYFSFRTLPRLVENCGYKVVEMLGEFPVELFLLNRASNYVKDRALGKDAHQTRVVLSNFIFDQGIEAYLDWSRALASTQIGRVIVCFIRKAN